MSENKPTINLKCRALTEAVKILSYVPKGALPVRASEQAKIDEYKDYSQKQSLR